MQYSRLKMIQHTVNTAAKQESEYYSREMRRRPIMISTSSPNTSIIPRAPTHLRGRRIGRTRSSITTYRNAPNSSATVNSSRPPPTYRTRAVRDREREQNQQDDDDNDSDHSVTSISSDSSDGTLAEDQISSSSSSSDSQSSGYSDWVGQVKSE